MTSDARMAHSLSDQLVGACGTLFLLVTWLGSLASPLVLLLALWFGWHAVTAAILGIAAIAYSPWVRRTASGARLVAAAMAKAFPSCSVTFVPGSTPAELSKAGKVGLYAIHPHGIFSMGMAQLMGRREINAHVHFAFSPYLFYTPIFHLFSRLVGKPARADKADMVRVMRRREHLALIPGGFEEATITSGGDADRVWIRKRCGFLKYCVQHGVSVVPVYCFGEKEMCAARSNLCAPHRVASRARCRSRYHNLQGAWSARLALNKRGLPGIVPWGRLLCPLVPRPRPLHVVVGEPLHFAQAAQPTAEQVADAHAMYIAALTELFDRHKVKCYGAAAASAELEVW